MVEPVEPPRSPLGLSPIARSSVVDTVATRLEAEILAGRLAAGSRLPSERELAVELGVNRLTLRASLARLEAQGLVETRHGAGTVVTSWKERAGLEALSPLLRSLTPGDPAFVDIVAALLEVRRVLAAEAVALAAERHTKADLARLAELADAQGANVGDAIAFARGDVAFERQVVRAGKNLGFELVLNTFARFPDEHPALVAELYDRRAESLAFYPWVIALIEGRDGALARSRIREGLAELDREWLRRHGRRPVEGVAAKSSKKKRSSKSPKSRR